MKYNLLLPMVGIAKRFLDAGYKMPKPLIMAHNRHIIDWAMSSIDYDDCNLIFIVRLEHVYNFAIDEILKQKFGNDITIVVVDGNTEGSVCTCLAARQYIDDNTPLVIYTPDVYFEPMFRITDVPADSDGHVLTFLANSPAHSYVLTDDSGKAIRTAEKQVISQNAAVGVYYFKTGSSFVTAAEQMISENVRINNEFYICPLYNYLIRHGKTVTIQQTEKMHVLGTPEDLEFFINRVMAVRRNLPIAICADHSGFNLKSAAIKALKGFGVPYIDFGTYTSHKCDYYDFVKEAIKAIQNNTCNMGFGFCRTGQGVNIAANKNHGINAALIFNTYAAEYAIRHNAANFFSFPSAIIDEEFIAAYIHIILMSTFDGGRHFTRIKEFYNR